MCIVLPTRSGVQTGGLQAIGGATWRPGIGWDTWSWKLPLGNHGENGLVGSVPTEIPFESGEAEAEELWR